LPVCDLRRWVRAVDFEVVADARGAPAIVGSKVRKIEFLDVAAEHDLTMVYVTAQEVVEADLAGIDFALCRRLPWLSNAYDPVARLRLCLPGALMGEHGAWPGCTLDAMFADRTDALNYQTTMNLRLWSSSNVPEEGLSFE
jgi:hypothetical protein